MYSADRKIIPEYRVRIILSVRAIRFSAAFTVGTLILRFVKNKKLRTAVDLIGSVRAVILAIALLIVPDTVAVGTLELPISTSLQVLILKNRPSEASIQ